MQLLSATFASLIVFSLISMIRGAPFKHNLQSRAEAPRELPKGYTVIGYRYVKKEVAEEYNKLNALLKLPASGVRLGEGAYIAPNLRDFKPPTKDYWRCEISAHAVDFKRMPKLWIPEEHQSKPREGKNIRELNYYIHMQQKSVRATILFSTMKPGDPGLQMLIPPTFLKNKKSHQPFERSAYDIHAICEAPKGKLMNPKKDEVDWKKLWPEVEFPDTSLPEAGTASK